MTALVLAAALLAQTGPSQGQIEGRILDAETGAPIAGATVQVLGQDLRTVTGEGGAFAIAGVPEGHRILSASAPRYAPATVRVLVPSDRAVRVELELVRDPRLVGRVIEAGTGQGVAGATVRASSGEVAEAGDDGGFALRLLWPDSVRLRAWAYGYHAVERVVDAGSVDTIQFALTPRPVGLPGLTASAVRAPVGAAAERALYQREVTPSVIGVGGAEAADLPVTLEPDLLRALQALPGVVAMNDLSARLHVRGGGPDQNLFLMDGTRIYAPYHMFGIFGSFNPDAVGRVELYRGAVPARFGGALSSVVDIEQRDGSVEPLRLDLGFSGLAGRATVSGRTPGVEGRWMLASRVSLVNEVFPVLFGLDSPVAFNDLQGRVSIAPSHDQRVRATFYRSYDEFTMLLNTQPGGIQSDWFNRAGSLRWDATLTPALTTAITAWTSQYGASIDVGTIGEAPVTRNEIGSFGLRAEAALQGDWIGSRTGIEVEGGQIDVIGADRAGGYVQGVTRTPYDAVAGFAEVEVDVSRFRLAPGMRVVRDARGKVMVEPRAAVRMALMDAVALTLGAGRIHQVISTLRDDRYVLPGAPIFFVHPDTAPASRSDGVTISLDGWLDRATSITVSGFGRRFDGLPWWRPAGSRDLASVRYARGRAAGYEAVVRRHHETLHGWIGYGLSWVDHWDPELDEWVGAPWDRRHSLDATVVWQPMAQLTVSGHFAYGSGLPFWPQAALTPAKWVDPQTGRIGDRAPYPLWGGEQLRYPDYGRLDLSVRGRFTGFGATWQPFASIRNVTGRPNVLLYTYRPHYDHSTDPPELVGGSLHPQLGPFSRWVPALGLDVEF